MARRNTPKTKKKRLTPKESTKDRTDIGHAGIAGSVYDTGQKINTDRHYQNGIQGKIRMG